MHRISVLNSFVDGNSDLYSKPEYENFGKDCREKENSGSGPERLLWVAPLLVAVTGVHHVVLGTSGGVPGFGQTGGVIAVPRHDLLCKATQII